MKIVAISDTHTQHDDLYLPAGDLLIHAGDFSYQGRPNEVRNFLEWFSDQPHNHKIFIAGNHELGLEVNNPFCGVNRELIKSFSNIIYLEHNSTIVEGRKIFGSPYTPEFNAWAFNVPRGRLHLYWQSIPKDTEILVTHGPPYGILDKTLRGDRVGDKEILEILPTLSDLKCHIFGHIHVNDRIQVDDKFVNASVLNEHYEMSNPPVVLEI